MEHVNRFIIQCGEAANIDELRVRLFSSSLSGSVFTWFISLPPNSVITWADLEKQFHKYFFYGIHEKKITDLVRLKQRNDESVESFVQRLQDVKNKCYRREHWTHCREPPDAGTVRPVLQKQPRVTSRLNSTVATNS